MNLTMLKRWFGSCAQMEGNASMRMLPLVMLTFSRQEADLVDSYQLGVNTSAVEPVGFRRLVDALRGPGMFWRVLDEPRPAVARN